MKVAFPSQVHKTQVVTESFNRYCLLTDDVYVHASHSACLRMTAHVLTGVSSSLLGLSSCLLLSVAGICYNVVCHIRRKSLTVSFSMVSINGASNVVCNAFVTQELARLRWCCPTDRVCCATSGRQHCCESSFFWTAFLLPFRDTLVLYCEPG